MTRCKYALTSWLVLILLTQVQTAWGRPASDFFAPPATDLRAALDPQGIYPRGQMIGFGLYSIQGQNDSDPSKTNMQRVAEAGFTLAGPAYREDGFGTVDRAAANGLHAAFSVRGDPSFENIHDPKEKLQQLAKLSDPQIRGHIRPLIQGVLDDPLANATVAQWALFPEEVPANNAAGINYLQVAADTIRQVESDNGVAHRPIWEYQPNGVTAASLATVGQGNPGARVKPLDFTTAGNYVTTRYPRGDQRSGYELNTLGQINRAANHLGTVPQAVYQLSEDFTDPLTGTDPAQIRKVIRHDVYLGLVHGMKSLEVWSDYENRPNLTTHEEQFDAYASVAHDLTGELDLQKVFLFGEERDDLAFLQTDGQSTITYKDARNDGAARLFDALSTLDVAYGEDRYLFLVNSAEDRTDVTIAGLPGLDGYRVEDLFTGATVTRSDPFLNLTLDNLGVRALKLTAIPEPATATLMLFGGAVLLRRRPRA